MQVDDRHYARVADLLSSGDVVPFFGAGANLCDRPDEAQWELGRYAPSGVELARTLAERGRYPDPHDLDLLRVSQYVDAILGEGQLYRYLHAVFDSDYPPSSIHRLFARLPALLRENSRPQFLDPDDELRRPDRACVRGCGRAIRRRLVRGQARTAAGSLPPPAARGEVVAIERPNKYTGLDIEKRPVILKLHGAIDRVDVKHDSYVVTEDSYIDYLVGADVGEQIPFSLRERMAESHFLFLGYGMRDWNLRVILNRIWGAQQLDLKSWAVQREPVDPRCA